MSNIKNTKNDATVPDQPDDLGDDAWLFHALQYAAFGWRITPWSNPEADVHSPPDDWQEKATSDPDELRQLHDQYPSKFNLAVRCGPESDVLVLDADRHENGEDGLQTLSSLQEELGDLPKTASVRSGGDGLHLYFQWADFGISGQDVIALGLDLKAGTAEKGAAAILPPSFRPKHDGQPYTWVNDPDDVGIAELPDPWKAWLRDQVEDESSGRSEDETAGSAPTDVDGFTLPQTIPEGERNRTLTSYAGKLRNDGLDRAELLGSLRLANRTRCEPPLPEGEVSAIADSVSGYEPSNPDAPVREKVEGLSLTFEPDPGEEIGELVVTDENGPVHIARLNITSGQRRTAVARQIRDQLPDAERPEESDLTDAMMDLAFSLRRRRQEAERQRRERALSESADEEPDWSNETEKRARSFLQKPNLLDKASSLMSARGLVGEESNRRVVFLSAVAGHLGFPIHLVVHGESSGGKNELTGRALELLPEHRVLNLSGLSTHALEYMGGQIGGVLILDEAEGQQDATYELRQAMSEGRVRRLTVNKTESGQMHSEELEVEVDASIITTTTEPQLHPENQTRVFDLWIDSSEVQTTSVLKEKARRAAAGSRASDAADHALEVWRCALDALEPREVTIPFAPELAEEFPTSRVRARRDYERVLDLIRAHALLHQRQREETKDGKLEATLEDYAAVRPLVLEVLGPSMAGLNETAVEIARVLEDIEGDTTFQKRADLQRACEGRDVASHNTVKKWVNRLHEAGVAEKKKQSGAWYVRLVRDPETEAVDLPEPEELEG